MNQNGLCIEKLTQVPLVISRTEWHVYIAHTRRDAGSSLQPLEAHAEDDSDMRLAVMSP